MSEARERQLEAEIERLKAVITELQLKQPKFHENAFVVRWPALGTEPKEET